MGSHESQAKGTVYMHVRIFGNANTMVSVVPVEVIALGVATKR